MHLRGMLTSPRASRGYQKAVYKHTSSNEKKRTKVLPCAGMWMSRNKTNKQKKYLLQALRPMAFLLTHIGACGVIGDYCALTWKSIATNINIKHKCRTVPFCSNIYTFIYQPRFGLCRFLGHCLPVQCFLILRFYKVSYKTRSEHHSVA